MIDKKHVVLVTGSTGFTGSYLLKKLCQTGCEVRAICRSSSNRKPFSALNITWFVGDVYDPALIQRAMQGVTLVFHLAAAYRQSNIDDEIYRLTHETSTEILATEALKQPDFQRFVHISTVGVLGHIQHPPADEQTPYNPGDIYQHTKTNAERWLLDFAQQNALPVTVVRPAAIYGPGDKRLLKLFKLAKWPLVPLIGFSQGLYHLIHVEDLVDFIIHISTLKKAESQIYICASPNASSIKQIIQIISAHLGKQARFIRLPAWPFFLLGDLCEWLARRCHFEPPIYRRRVAFFTKDRAFNTQKMQHHAGFQSKHSDKQGLCELADWYKNEHWL